MSREMKPGTCKLWPNKTRKTHNSPNYGGYIKLHDGRMYRCAGWDNDEKFGGGISIKLDEEEFDPANPNPRSRTEGVNQPHRHRPVVDENPPPRPKRQSHAPATQFVDDSDIPF